MNGLSVAEKHELDKYIENAMQASKHNISEVGRLMLLASSAAASAQTRSETLANQKFLKNLWNNITGKNRKMQNNINYNNARAVYMANQLIVKLAQQEQMTLGILQGVQSRLSAGIASAEREINELYLHVRNVYSDLKQMHEKIYQIEKDVRILQWVNAVEVSEEIKNMPPEIAVCRLALDFYRIKNTQYEKSDLIQLKSALKKADILDEKMSYRQFVDRVRQNATIVNTFEINNYTQQVLTPSAVGLMCGADDIYDNTGADPDTVFDMFDFAQMLLIEYAEIEKSCYEAKVHAALPEMVKRAQNGDVQAQYDVAIVYFSRGEYPKGWECMQIAAKNGSQAAKDFIIKNKGE